MRMFVVNQKDMNTSSHTVWLFCRVIDNFGDIGVSWRLAKQLQQEQQMHVVLWVDDVQALQALLPEVDVLAQYACYEDITVVQWQDALVGELLLKTPAADVVIETFACDVPAEVRQWMVGKPIVWLNLEYLTAETWVDDVHLLPSLQGNGVKKCFFCPGFSDKTGGVSYEQALLSQERPVSMEKQQQLRQQFGLPSFADSVHVYVFGYADAMWPKWLRMWMQGMQKTVVWLAQGGLLADLQTHFPELQALQQVGDKVILQRVTVCLVPFVAQSDFDDVLQAADVSVVRGEDSVLRALWQGRVFWWQIYRQEEHAHHIKLHAFWQRCKEHVQGLQAACFDDVWKAHQALSDELNGVRVLHESERAQAWEAVMQHQAVLMAVLQAWREQLWQQQSLATQLANFMRLQLK